MKQKSNIRFLIFPAIPLILFSVCFITETLTAPSTEIDIKTRITHDYQKNSLAFTGLINYLRNTKSVWSKYEINFHPGQGTQFYSFSALDTSKMTYADYRARYCKNIKEGVAINYYPDFYLDETILGAIKRLNISRINFVKDSSITFLYKYRTFNPPGYDFYIRYSINGTDIQKKSTIWRSPINDSIYCYALKSN